MVTEEIRSLVPSREELQQRSQKAAQTLAARSQTMNVDFLYIVYRLEAVERLLREADIDTARLDYLADLCRTEDLEDKVRTTSSILTVSAIPNRSS